MQFSIIIPNPNLFLAFELLALVSFIFILLREIFQKDKIRVFEILSCAVFGMILEIGNTYLAHTYSYSSNFLIQIFNVPLAIGLGWAVIVYCAMLLSDQYNMPWKIRPFMDALTALFLDLSMDAVAIRLGFWKWSIPLSQEWYGVPFENLVGWIFVVFTFSFLMRFIRTLNWQRAWTRTLMLLSPFISYVFLVLELTIFSLITILPYQINNWTTLLKFNYVPDFMILYNSQVQLWKVIVLVILVTTMINIVIRAVADKRRDYLYQFDLLSFLVLSIFHVFFLVSIFVSGIYKELPVLIVIGLNMFLIHCLMHFLPYLANPKVVYLFHKTKKMIKKREEGIQRIIEDSLR
ncbi:MAG: carotenoid biosynthesis protein [Candidatus Pacebacteria bacterium]|nr:carotenoid biosynthesis protein [Candidatus Paceibacterota bacterium]